MKHVRKCALIAFSVDTYTGLDLNSVFIICHFPAVSDMYFFYESGRIIWVLPVFSDLPVRSDHLSCPFDLSFSDFHLIVSVFRRKCNDDCFFRCIVYNRYLFVIDRIEYF